MAWGSEIVAVGASGGTITVDLERGLGQLERGEVGAAAKGMPSIAATEAPAVDEPRTYVGTLVACP